MIGLELFRATRHLGSGLFSALADLGTARTSPPRDDREAAHRLAGAVGALARSHKLVVETRGEITRGPALIVANHVSYLDPIVILPRSPAIPVAKAEVRDWPVIGNIAEALGAVFVSRRDRMSRARALRRIYELLAAGVPVLNFPEGTTTRGDYVQPFLRGSFGIAQRLGVPVVPVAIRYRDPDMAWFGGTSFLPHYLRTAAQPKIEVTLTFCPPMPVRVGEQPEDMAVRTRHTIMRALGEMRTHAGQRNELSTPRSNSVLPPSTDA